MAQMIQIPDLPPAEHERARNIASQRKIKEMGDRYGGEGDKWLQAAQQTSQMHGVPLWQIEKTISRESNWNPQARAKGSTATGLGQFVSSTAGEYGVNPIDPISSIHGVGKYLGALSNKLGTNDFGELTKAYVLGPGGYRTLQKGGNPTGAEQLGSVNAWLAKNAPEDSPLPGDITQGIGPGNTAFGSRHPQIEGQVFGISEQLEHPLQEDRLAQLQQLAAQREDEIEEERRKMMGSTGSTSQLGALGALSSLNQLS